MISTVTRKYPYYLYGLPDEYGQVKLSSEPEGVVKMAVYLTTQSAADNIRYSDAEYIGLTNEPEISERYVIDYRGQRLKVLHVQPQGRVKQVFMKAM